MSTSKKLPGNSEFEATHSLEEVKRMAREKGISTAGTKREIAARLKDSRGRVSLPQTTPKEQYSWQYLEQLPYGMSMWDTALIEGARTVTFMAREARADVQSLPKSVNVKWKALSLGVEIGGRRIMPVVVMVHFIPLQTIYEVWFNFYGEAQESVQEAFTLLAQQPNLYLFFHDRGPEPVRKFGFENNIAYFFRGHYNLLKAMPEWSDKDFDKAKLWLMNHYTGEQLWRVNPQAVPMTEDKLFGRYHRPLPDEAY